MSKINDNIYFNILNSSNPDKNYEIFWLGMKDCVMKFADKEIIKEITNTTILLNEHQKNKNYNEIYNLIHHFFDLYSKKICLIAMQDSIMSVWYTYLYLKRWKRLDDNFNTESLELSLFFQIGLMLKKKFSVEFLIRTTIQICLIEKELNELNQLIQINQLNQLKLNLIEMLFEKSILEKNIGIIDLLKKYINLSKYVKSNINLKVHSTTKGYKLLKILNNLD